MKRRGFTLLEILIVSGLVVTVVSCLFLLYLSYGRTSGEQTKEQEYYQKMAQLEARLKQDLRSAVALKREVDGVYTLETIRLSQAGTPEKKVVVYWVDEEGYGVERFDAESGERRVWDFSGVLEEGKRFVFEIEI